MKRTKQILTLFLSVLMIFSTISMAFASEKKKHVVRIVYN